MREQREYSSLGRRERRPGTVRSLGGNSRLELVAGKWRPILLVAALVLIGVSLLGRIGQGGEGSPTPQTSPAATATTKQGTAATAVKEASPKPQASATPDTIRPVVGTVAPRPVQTGPAPTRKSGSPDPQPSTERFVVMDGASGAVMFEQNSRVPIAPASLTKIMTAILGVERGNIADYPKIDVNANDFSDSTVMGLAPGLNLTFEDLLYGLMLPSGNDAAVQIARYVAGDEKTFVRLMNEKAFFLGLTSTHFSNPHGLDASDHYSSPYDMAVMARYGMQYPTFQKLSAARSYDISRSNIAYTLHNLNPILGTYSGADGVKVGYTESSGRSIVASATRNGHRVFVAFMQSTAGLAPDSNHLLDWAFAYHTWPN